MSETVEKRSKEQIDKINEMRSNLGHEPLVYEHEEALVADDNTGKTEEEIKAAAAETERLALLAKEEEEKNKNNPATSVAETPKELSEEEIEKLALQYLSKKKGSEVNSIEELLNPKVELTEEQKLQQQEQREAEILAFGLKSGKISKKEMESFNVDMNDPLAVVYNDFKADLLADDAELKEDEIQEAFNNKFNQDKDQNSIDFKLGKKQVEIIASTIINKKHSKVFGLNAEYDAFENSEKSKIETETKLSKAIPVYVNDVEKAFEASKKVTIKISGTESFDFVVEESEAMTKLKTDVLDKKFAVSKINAAYTSDELNEEINTAVILTNLPQILESYAAKKNLEKQAGTRGIPPVDGASKGQEEVISDRKKTLYQYHGGEKALPAN